MTVAVAPRYKTFVGNDTTGPFSFTFPILLSNSGTPYITVKSIDAAGVETTLAITTGYTFTPLLLGKGGGIITTIASIPSDGSKLFVEATTPLDQGVRYPNQGTFYAETHENSFDKIHFILIENVQKGDLSVKFPSSEIGVDTILPVAAQRANTSLGFDGSGNLSCGALSSVMVSVTMTAFVQSATIAQARTAMGLGTASTSDADDFDAAGSAAAVLSSSVQKSGSTMTGALELSGDPTAALHPVTKQYLEAYYPPKLATASGSAPSYSARAWCKFQGSGSPSILGSGNIASLTDNGTGDWTLAFSTNMPDANYACEATMGQTSVGTYSGQNVSVQAATTSSFRVKVFSDAGSAFDPEHLHVIVMR